MPFEDFYSLKTVLSLHSVHSLLPGGEMDERVTNLNDDAFLSVTMNVV